MSGYPKSTIKIVRAIKNTISSITVSTDQIRWCCYSYLEWSAFRDPDLSHTLMSDSLSSESQYPDRLPVILCTQWLRTKIQGLWSDLSSPAGLDLYRFKQMLSTNSREITQRPSLTCDGTHLPRCGWLQLLSHFVLWLRDRKDLCLRTLESARYATANRKSQRSSKLQIPL